MPKIKITEIDNTGVVQSGIISNTVYIPGKVVSTGDAEEPKLFTSISQLRDYNYTNYSSTGTNTPLHYDDASLSYKLMEHLLTLGMYVLYEGIKEASEGVAPTIDWTRLEDKGLYDIRFLTMGEYGVVQAGMLSCAEHRGDCVALLDHPTTLETQGATQALKVRAYFEGFKSGNTSYSAAFTPGFKTQLETLGGSSTTPKHIPASFGYLFAYAKSVQANPDWYAVAGGQRGIIPELSEVEYNYTSADIEVLQGRAKTGEVPLDDDADNVGCAINPIAYVRPFGYIIWGNRTFKENDAVKKTTATSFLNVRNLVSAVKKSMYNAARKYTFEPNSDMLWVNFKSQIIPLLDQMKNGNGILGYKFVKLATTAKARLKARLIIIPIEAVEDFELEIELNDTISTTEE